VWPSVAEPASPRGAATTFSCVLRQTQLIAVIAVALLSIASCGGSSNDATDAPAAASSVDTRPRPKPPPVDPRAGEPVFLAVSAERHILLDRAGRVARVLPRAVGISARPCPGGRVWFSAPSWGAGVVVRTIDGGRIWRRRLPVAVLGGAACMDPEGRQIALVREYDEVPEGRSYWRQRLIIVSRRGVRYRPSYVGTTPLLEPDRMYVSDERGVQIREVPSGRLLRRIPGEPGSHDISPSPDRRFAVLTQGDLTDIFLLADLGTGHTRPIEIPRMRVVGWLAADRLAVTSGRTLLVLDTELQEVSRVDDFRAGDWIIDNGEVIARDGRTLVAVRPGSGAVMTLGTAPKGTDLISTFPPR
jgi:hypothetical protein